MRSGILARFQSAPRRPVLFGLSLVVCALALACNGGKYDRFLESSLVREDDLGTEWRRFEGKQIDNNQDGERLRGCPTAKASRASDYERRTGEGFQAVVIVLSQNHGCLEPVVNAATSASRATIDEMSGVGCPTRIIRFAPNENGELATWVFVAGDQSMAYLNFSAAYAGDESFFHSVAEKTCERLNAAEAEHL